MPDPKIISDAHMIELSLDLFLMLYEKYGSWQRAKAEVLRTAFPDVYPTPPGSARQSSEVVKDGNTTSEPG